MLTKPNKIIPLALCFLLIFEQSGFAQASSSLDLSGYISGLKSTLTQDKYRPLHLRYLGYEANSDNFKLLLDKGDYFEKQSMVHSPSSIDKTKTHEPTNSLTHELNNSLTHEINTLMEYFFIGLALPNESFWVNLRPDSPDNIINSKLAQTDIGKIFLEADVQLKKDTALYTSPQTTEGKKYWDKLYKKAEELYGYNNITIPTLTRPWIVPGEIIIRETPNNAYIYKATLKVMLEEDYLKNGQSVSLRGALATKQSFNKIASLSARNATLDPRAKELNTYSTQLIKELIIPKLTKDINTSKRYAKIRQVYYSLILAQWFKKQPSVKNNLQLTTYDLRQNINSGDLTGLTSKTPWTKDTYYQEYQKSFKNGEYSLKKSMYTAYGQTIRNYFSGGISFGQEITTTVSSGIIQGNSKLNPEDIFSKIAINSAMNNNILIAVKNTGLNKKINLEIQVSSAIDSKIDRDISKTGHFKPSLHTYYTLAKIGIAKTFSALCIAAVTLGISLFTPSLSAFTNKQIFSKGGVPQNAIQIEKGDNLWDIVTMLSANQETTINNSQIRELIQKIKSENPQIINEDLIFPGQEINVEGTTDKLTLIKLLAESKLITTLDIDISGKKTKVYFIKSPKAGVTGIATCLTNDIIMNVTEFKEEVIRIKEQGQTAYKGLENREKFIKELFDNKSDYQIFSAYLKETLYHEIAHQETDKMIKEGNLQGDIEKLLSQTRYYQGIDLRYSVIQELAGLLAQLTYSSNPKYFLDILKLKALGRGLQGPQYQYAGAIITKRFTEKFKEHFFKSAGDRKIEERKQKENRDITKEDEDSIRKVISLYYEAGFYDNKYEHFYEFINTLTDEEIKNTAREIYEKYFGELPSPDLIKIPQEVFEAAGYKSGTTTPKTSPKQEKPVSKQIEPAKSVSSAIPNNQNIDSFIETSFSNEFKGNIVKIITTMNDSWNRTKQKIQELTNIDDINNEFVRRWSIYFYRGRIYNPTTRLGAKEKANAQAVIFEFSNELKNMLHYNKPDRSIALCFAQLELKKSPLLRILITQGLNKNEIKEKFVKIGVNIPVSYLEESELSFNADPPDKNKYYYSALSNNLPSILGHKSLLSTLARGDLYNLISNITEEINKESLDILKNDDLLLKSVVGYIVENKDLFKEKLNTTTSEKNTNTVHEKKKFKIEASTSSSINTNKGGIDFGAMPIVTRAVNSPLNNFNAVSSGLLHSYGEKLDCPNKSGDNNKIDTEWLEIEKMVNAGIIPSDKRIKEYLVNSGLRNDCDNNLQKVLCCMAAILRLEEEKSNSISTEYKRIISLLESTESLDEIRISLK